MQVSLSQYWGNLRPGQNYNVIDEGRDWVKIRNNGRALYIPKILTLPPVSEKVVYEEEESEYDYDN